MLDDLTKLAGKKAKELKPQDEGLADKVEESTWDLRKHGEVLGEKTVDTAIRTTGKVKGNFMFPKSETEKKLFKETTWFLCSHCDNRLGPVIDKMWRKILNASLSGAKVVLGVATANPLLLAGGAVSLSTMRRSDKGFIDRFKADRRSQERAREFLLQCEYCGDWFCSDCWNLEKNVCTLCTGKGLSSMLGL